MELRHLQSFCAVATEMHVTRAAKRLHIAQPALTQQIRLLEKELGMPLIRRTGRGIALTEAGEFFHKEAELILQHLNSACTQTRKIARGDLGHIVVGVTEASAFSPVLAEVFSRYRARWPAVQLTLSQKQANEFGAALRERQIDAAFTCPLATGDSDLISHNLSQDRMLLAVPKAHPFAGRRAVFLPDLKDEPLILVAHDQTAGAFEGALRAACGSHDFFPQIIQTSPKLMLALNMVAAGVGLAFVPEYMGHARLDALRCVPIRDQSPLVLGVDFVTRVQEESPLVAHLKDIAVSTFAEAGNETSSGSLQNHVLERDP